MNGEGGAAPAQTSDIRKVGVASSIGAMVEWYDFHLYGYASAIVFAQLFFPEVDPVIGTLSAFGTFAVGFFARPVGAIVFATTAIASGASRCS
jgi:MFS transporter, MHS family, shikimate and dehydroshikimate transport protein